MCLCQCKSRGDLTLSLLGSSQPLGGDAGARCTGRSMTPPWAVGGQKCCCKHHGPEGLDQGCGAARQMHRAQDFKPWSSSLQQETRPRVRTTAQP